ncbi:alkaline phosphatase [Thalassobacillus sp. CUG 92003]|uniref:alkaline phosphatase n=1 Tax=Thalassobacillus sp. CUG 92003 TaxID=2736641 RepID=UPI0015E70FDB
MFKKIAAVVVISLLMFIGATFVVEKAHAGGHDNAEEKVENVIYLIPDGYSAGYATNYRWYKGEDSVFDPYLKGMMKTYSKDSEVTDSAAAGTAMATGQKTDNGMVGVTPDGKELTSILDASEAAGKSSGLVATSTITHATPAVFGSSVKDRDDESKIAPQYLENGVDVILGGGRKFFLSESEGGTQAEDNLVKVAQNEGYAYVEDRAQLMMMDNSDKVLGLFAEGPLSSELDREDTQEPSLEEMTSSAIDTLSKDEDGFFLMVEGSQIDWAGHAHDAPWAMKDTEAFEMAAKKALDFAKKDKHTLVVIAGDHETGGMTVGANGEYDVKTEVLQRVSATGDYMAAQLDDEQSNIKKVVKEYTGLDLNEKEVEKIRASENPNNAINAIVSDYALVGWTSSAHTGVDVPIYAYGPSADDFSGLVNNTDLPKKMAAAMDIELTTDSAKPSWEDQNEREYALPAGDWDPFSVVDLLKSHGYNSSLTFRGKVANDYDINDYKGTAKQNIFLLQELKEELNRN